MEQIKTLLQEKLLKPIQLPSLARNIPTLMQTLADEKLTFQQVADVIKQHPEITTRLLFLANSSWSSPINPINSIDQACSRLGRSMVKSISIAISIASSFDTRKCPLFSTTHFWTSSMLVAEGAKILASKIPNHDVKPEFENTVQTAGILHNLGLLWLADNAPIETNQALQLVANESSSLTLVNALRQCTGTDYCEIGGRIAQQLKLPIELIAPMEHHIVADYQDDSWRIVQLIGTTATMVSALRKQTENIPANTRLEMLGLDASIQHEVYQNLGKNFEKTCALAKILFG